MADLNHRFLIATLVIWQCVPQRGMRETFEVKTELPGGNVAAITLNNLLHVFNGNVARKLLVGLF